MELWEYQVIHLNVEGAASQPGQAPPPASPAAPAPESGPSPPPPPPQQQPVFSREYLEKEFPGFYATGPGAAGGTRKEHPAQQLRGFLNSQGREGWSLVGFFPVGQLTMIVFRRPLAAVPAGTSGSAPASVSHAGSAHAGSGEPGPAQPGLAGAEAPSASRPPDLEMLLARIETLEQRLAAVQGPAAAACGPQQQTGADDDPAPAPALRLTAEPALDARELAALRDGALLDGHTLRRLALPRSSTAATARALGFRSSASLLNPAARSGYRPGLVKRGSNGRVAVYVGSERNERGGRDRRWWVVLPAG